MITLLNFEKTNKNTLLFEFVVPDTIYDKKRVTGILSKSSDIPNCRYGFFEKTKLYIIILQAPWHGYPRCLWEIKVFGLKDAVENIDN